MKIQLDGFTAEIEEIYAYRTYLGLLCGRIDTRINNREESQTQVELNKFTRDEKSNFYISPLRKRCKLSSFSKKMKKYIKEDYLDGHYHKKNFPEESLENFWVLIELVT